MILENRSQSVELNNMLPNEWWGCRRGWRRASEPQDVSESLSCHVVTEVVLNSSRLTPNSSLLFNAGDIK